MISGRTEILKGLITHTLGNTAAMMQIITCCRLYLKGAL